MWDGQPATCRVTWGKRQLTGVLHAAWWPLQPTNSYLCRNIKSRWLREGTSLKISFWSKEEFFLWFFCWLYCRLQCQSCWDSTVRLIRSFPRVFITCPMWDNHFAKYSAYDQLQNSLYHHRAHSLPVSIIPSPSQNVQTALKAVGRSKKTAARQCVHSVMEKGLQSWSGGAREELLEDAWCKLRTEICRWVSLVKAGLSMLSWVSCNKLLFSKDTFAWLWVPKEFCLPWPVLSLELGGFRR